MSGTLETVGIMILVPGLCAGCYALFFFANSYVADMPLNNSGPIPSLTDDTPGVNPYQCVIIHEGEDVLSLARTLGPDKKSITDTSGLVAFGNNGEVITQFTLFSNTYGQKIASDFNNRGIRRVCTGDNQHYPKAPNPHNLTSHTVFSHKVNNRSINVFNEQTRKRMS